MTSFPSLSFRDLIKRVEKLGFTSVRQRGLHIRFIHHDGRKTTIPDHGGKDVPHGLLVKIIRYDLKMEPKDFFFDR